MAKDINLSAAARGTGALYRRHRLTVTQAVEAAAQLWPQLDSALVRKGWNSEASAGYGLRDRSAA